MRVLPSCQLLRLVLRKAGFHGKLGFGKIERFLQFEWLGHGSIGSVPFFCASFPSSSLKRVAGENIGEQCNHVCYNEKKQVSAGTGVQSIRHHQNGTCDPAVSGISASIVKGGGSEWHTRRATLLTVCRQIQVSRRRRSPTRSLPHP